MGQAFKRMGSKDPRTASTGCEIDYRISQQLRGYNKTDPPPRRVRPAPITLVLHILDSTFGGGHAPTAAESAIADMICIAFFYLLRPGEYTGTTNDDAAFTLDDVRLNLGARHLDIKTAPLAEIEAATSMSLYFTTQKNQRKGDSIAHGRSQHPRCCPVRSAIRLITAHRAHFASLGTPFDATTKLASYYYRGHNLKVLASDVTTRLRLAATSCFYITGIPATDISARSLRAGGAMALLCAGVDSAKIRLLGRWESDSVFRYLHQDATPIMTRLASRMFRHGTYTFLPSTSDPDAA